MNTVGDKIKDIQGESQLGWIRLRDLISGAWGLVITFPMDYHPVWATVCVSYESYMIKDFFLQELGALAKLKSEFDARNCRILGLHVSTAERQDTFIAHVNETQEVEVNFPLIYDIDAKISKRNGLVPQDFDSVTKPFKYSTILLYDLDLTLRFSMQYPTSVGRNIYEVIRALDALQLSKFNQVVTPTNWKVNDDVFVEPDVTSEAAKLLFPQGFHEIKPYFRITPSPAVVENS